MNTPTRHAVERQRSSKWALVAAFVATLGNSQCIEINGGAVELAWAVRDYEGDKNTCSKSGITDVKICWQAIGDGAPYPDPECQAVNTDAGFVEQFATFPCVNNRGVSRFEVPPGPTSFFVRLTCEDGAAPEGPFQTPPPVERNVLSGEIVTLDQILIVASNLECDSNGCRCIHPDTCTCQ